MQEIVEPSSELLNNIKRIKAAQTLGSIASQLELQAFKARSSVRELDIKSELAPEGHGFRINVKKTKKH